MEEVPEKYISVLGSVYIYPIAALLEKLKGLNLNTPNEVQASTLDNGYSVAIIVLTVLMVESVIGRTKYVLGKSNVQGKLKSIKPIDFVRAKYPNSGFAEKIEELFVIRDVVAHNHLWEASFNWDETNGMKFVDNPVIQQDYGDLKFNRVIDWNTRQTRLLGINLFPTRVNHADAVTVLKIAVEFLKFLENQDRNFVYFTHLNVIYCGESVSFAKLIEALAL